MVSIRQCLDAPDENEEVIQGKSKTWCEVQKLFPIFHPSTNQTLENIQTYFFVGWNHMMNLSSWDHWMFTILLVLPFEFQDWKKWLTAISLFTLGHTLTLVLCAFFPNLLAVSWIETAIVATIVFTAFGNIFQWSGKNFFWSGILSSFFGLLHGLAFGKDVAGMLPQEGKFSSIVGFGLGLEAAQLVGVLSVLVITTIFNSVVPNKNRELVLVVSGIGIGMSLFKLIF
jgi:hypothetical protein